MNDPVSQELNLKNLEDMFSLIGHLEPFVFFGTLLGYTREGNIIAHDDDIDFYVDIKHQRRLYRALKRSGFNLTPLATSHKQYSFVKRQLRKAIRNPCFVQATRDLEGIRTYCDFYFYDASHPEFISDRWNFRGRWRRPDFELHTPKSLVFPIQDAKMQGFDIKVPAKPEAICEFLYGPSWKVPMRKDSEYRMEIVDNRPKFIPT